MKRLNIRYAGAWNFMPFGPEGIELYFADYGQLVLVKGTNLDVGTPSRPGSNGAGKSTIQDIIAYALYGETVKEPKDLDHGTVINQKSNKKLVVEVQFDDYRVVRCREPNKLDVWHSPDHIWDNTTKVTRGSARDTQAFIEGLIGLSHAAFCTVMVFDDSNVHTFLELDTAGKRNVVDNVLGLERYRDYQGAAKEAVKNQKVLIKDLARDVATHRDGVADADRRIAEAKSQHEKWRSTRQAEILQLSQQKREKQSQLDATDDGPALAQYEESQKKAAALVSLIERGKATHEKIVKEVAAANEAVADASRTVIAIDDEIRVIKQKLRSNNDEITKARHLVKELESLREGAKCPACHGTVSRENYATLLESQKKILADLERDEIAMNEKQREAEGRLSAAIVGRGGSRERFEELCRKRDTMSSQLDKAQQERTRLLNTPRPQPGVVAQRLADTIILIDSQIESKKQELNGAGPYKGILERAEQDRTDRQELLDKRTIDLKEAEVHLSYLEWWVDAFGDKGIRKHIVERILPSLNSRIAFWLQYLYDSLIEVTFDNEFKETITRNGVPAKYRAMSNGEKRRINLAVSRAFAHILVLNSGHYPSIVFLDEVTGGGIDEAGIPGVYRMITELAKNQQVFVTSHNPTLLDLMDGCQTIELVKKDDITTMKR